MGASASQIASARALAQSRGYDPNLVDADNADRANSAFPIKSGGQPARPTTAPASAPNAGMAGGTATSTTPSSAPITPVGVGGAAGGGADPGTVPDTTTAGGAPNPASGIPSMGALMGGGGGDTGGSTLPSMGGLLRPLGQRNPSQPSFELAQRGRRVY